MKLRFDEHKSIRAYVAVAVVLLASPAFAQDFATRVDSIAVQTLRNTGVPSASVAVVQHGQIILAKAYGDARLEPRTSASAEMRYAVGSISKQFTASALLLLQQEGKLRIDDPVGKYVSGLARGNEVTIRQILSHTSGYSDFWPQDYLMPPMRNDVKPEQIVHDWAGKSLDFEPGARYQYSNTGYTLAALIVEKVSGMPFFKFVQTRLLDPAAMSSARDFDSNPRAPDATGYIRYGLGPLRAAPDAGKGWMYGAGMLAMTASDLAKWDLTVIKRSLLSPASYKELTATIRLNSGASAGYGLGVSVFMQGGHPVIEHSGEVSGFTAENLVYPEDSAAIVVLTNQDAAPASGSIASQIARVMFATDDPQAAGRTAEARGIFEGLQKGTVNRSLFTDNANAYFGEQALKDFASTLAPLGAPTGFVQTGSSKRGGYIGRSYRVTFPNQTLRVWTFEVPGGKLEQYQIAPIG